MTSPQYRAVKKEAECTVVLPWPDRKLHPNARVHWSVKAGAVKKARRDAFYACRASGLGAAPGDIALNITATFFPPDNHARDDDGLLSSLKAAFDGIADALSVDDGRFRIQPIRRGHVVKRGEVHIEISVVDTWEQVGEAAGRVIASIPTPKRGAA
jgi:crossover junction endodeoxyribonuclease RusA